jgi:hypothetical protein
MDGIKLYSGHNSARECNKLTKCRFSTIERPAQREYSKIWEMGLPWGVSAAVSSTLSKVIVVHQSIFDVEPYKDN